MIHQRNIYKVLNFWNKYKSSSNITNVYHSSKCISRYSTASADAAFVSPMEVSVEQPIETSAGRPVSEMPGINTFSAITEFLKAKISHNGGLNAFDSREILNTFQILRDLHGPIFKVDIVGRPKMVIITNPEDVEEMYKNTEKNPVRLGFSALKKIRMEADENYFEKKGGVAIENNEEWRRVRTRVQATILRPKNVVKYLKEMDHVARDFTKRVAELQRMYGEMPSDFQQELFKFTLEIVGVVALNRRLGCLDPNISTDSEKLKIANSVFTFFKMLNITQNQIQWWKYFPSPTYNKLKESHDFVMSVAHGHVEESENELFKKIKMEGESNLELSMLETFLLTEGLTKKDVVTFIMDMFLAGVDTTANSLSFTLYLLAKNQEKQKKLQEELDSVLGDGKETLTEEQLSKLSYLKACVKESLRLFPAAPIQARQLQDDAFLGGYKIPKGYIVIVANTIAGRNEDYFRHSNEFIPERWMRNRPLGQIHPYAFFAFSNGPRMCLGKRIAEQEMHTFLARLVHKFNVEYDYEDMKVVSRFIATPSEPLRFKFIKRN